MKIFRALFPLKCEECGKIIKGETYPGLRPGPLCEACHNRLEEERVRRDRETNRERAQQVVDRVTKDFLPEDIHEVFTILAEYGKAKSESPDQEFMQLAVLRLANGDKEKLAKLVRVAKGDRRDILAEIYREYGQDWLERFVNE